MQDSQLAEELLAQLMKGSATAGAGVVSRGIHVLLVGADILPTFCPVKGEEQSSNCCSLPAARPACTAASSDVTSEYKMDQHSPQS